MSIADVTDQKARFADSGWDVFECDGHDPAAIDAAITAAKASPRPAMIACATHIALGSSAQDTSKGHGALTDAKLMAVPISVSADGKAVKPGTPLPLFATQIAGGPTPGTNSQQYVVSPDGQRFLVNVATDEASTPITLILNWTGNSR